MSQETDRVASSADAFDLVAGAINPLVIGIRVVAESINLEYDDAGERVRRTWPTIDSTRPHEATSRPLSR